MRNSAVLVFILLLVYSCAFRQEGKAGSAELELLSNPIGISSLSTAYEFPNIDLPQHYYLDSIVICDSISRAKFSAYYVQSTLPTRKELNQTIRQFVEDQIAIERSSLDPYSDDLPIVVAHSYKLRPTEVYLDSQMISVSSIIDTYTEGSAHHNYRRRSLNYDLNAGAIVKFGDVFELRDKIDSVEFVEYVKSLSDGCEDWEWSYKDLDFSFTDSGVYINPRLSWACVSTRSMLPACAANKYLKRSLQFQLPCEK